MLTTTEIRRGCIFKVAFETDPSTVIFRLIRHMKKEKKEINICLEAKDWSELFLRYSEVAAPHGEW